jgi:3-phenylpropionate/trans-cinnamate dioxygenase ferredoxin subunit
MRDFATPNGKHVLVVNCDGRFYAIEDRCTHDDGPLAEGDLLGCHVECPRHGARFDAETGKALTLPAVRPVASYPVRVTDDGALEVDLNVETPTPPRRPRPGRPDQRR